MKTIDKRTALRMLTKIVKAQPEKVAHCHYVAPGSYGEPTAKPECVAGVFMHDLGVKVADLPNDIFSDIMVKVNDETDGSWNANKVRKAFGDVRLSRGATHLVAFIQAVQDGRPHSAADIIFDSEGPEVWDARKAFIKDVDSHNDESERGDRPNWSTALAFTVANYDKF